MRFVRAVNAARGQDLGGRIGVADRWWLRLRGLSGRMDLADSFSQTLRSSENGKVQQVAGFLQQGSAQIIIAGFTDERGTAEYNRALGERRALAAREALLGLGVDGASVQTISYGKDKPLDPGHDEVAWSKNRRAEFVIIK